MKRVVSLVAILALVIAFAIPIGMAEAAKNPCNPCAAKKMNPCNPCAAKANPCNPCNPCAAKKKKW